MLRLLGLLGAALLAAGGFVTPTAGAELPAVKLLAAPLVSPAAAWSYYGSATLHTSGVAAWTGNPPEIKALARTLGAGREGADQYAQNVLDYVRNNIGVEFRFGLGKGARGALIDQSGTPFDQAELMVKLLREGGVSASYQLGTITLSAQQFGRWSGLIKGLVASSQTFTVSAKAACQLLADGGVPATFAGGGDCEGLSGDLGTVILGHVWVLANGKLYDPSFKRHILKAQIDIAATVGCGSSAAPTCGAAVTSAAIGGASSGTLAGSTYFQNLNEAAVGAQLQAYAVNLQNALQTANAELDDVIGGKRIDLANQAAPAASLPYATTLQTTWTGDIPDQYRSTLGVQLEAIDQTFYADEIAGRRVRLFGVNTVGGLDPANNPTPRELFSDDALIASVACSTCSQMAVVGTITLTADHPYAAISGTYGDESTTQGLNVNQPVTIIQAWGESAPGTVSHYANLQKVDPTPYAPTGGGTCSDATYVYTICRDDAQPVIAAQVLSQRDMAGRIVATLGGDLITHHHSIGVIFSTVPINSAYTYASRPQATTFQSAFSVNAKTADATARSAGFQAVAAVSSMIEGSVPQQAANSWEPISAVAGLVLYNRAHQKLVNVVGGSAMTNLIPSLVNYTAADTLTLQDAANGGYAFILPQEATLPSLTASFVGVFGHKASLGYKADRQAYLLDFNLKGGGGATGDDPTKSVLDTVKQQAVTLKAAKYASVDLASGDLRLTPPADLVTGSGGFPFSLSFQRQYSSSDASVRRVERTRLFMLGPNDVHPRWYDIAMPFYDGPGAEGRLQAAGDWSFNWAITARLGSDPLKAMGQSSAVDASGFVAGVYALLDASRSGSFQGQLASVLTTYWLGRLFIDNAITINRPPGAEVFQRLPSGTFHAPPGSGSNVVQTGARGPAQINAETGIFNYNPVAIDYTDNDGAVIHFDVARQVKLADDGAGIYDCAAAALIGQPSFKAKTWTFPNRLVITFNYERTCPVTSPPYADVEHARTGTVDLLRSVANSVGRSLTFVAAGAGDNTATLPLSISTVTDDSGRVVTFGSNANGLTVTTPDNAVAIYGYTAGADSPDPAVKLRASNRLRRWYTPSNLTTPYQVVTYDELFRVSAVTDILNRRTRYFPGAIAGSEGWKRGQAISPRQDVVEITTSIFDEKNNLIKTTDPLGRPTIQAYDKAGRLIRTVLPEGNAVEQTYDMRGNVLSTCRIPKARADLPCDLSAGDVSTRATYVEGPNVAVCSNQATCNKPAFVFDGIGYSTTYSWNGPTGLLSRIQKASVEGGTPIISYTYNNNNPIGVWFLQKINEKNLIYVEDDNGNQVEAETSSPDLTTVFTYASTPHYALESMTTGGSNRTWFFYNAIGDVVGVDGPRTDVVDMRSSVWDANRRLVYALEPSAVSAGQSLRSTVHSIYDIDGQLQRTDQGYVPASTALDLNAVATAFVPLAATAFAYDAVGNRVRADEAPGTPDAMLTHYSYDADDRLVCTAVRMNRPLFASLPAVTDACTPTATSLDFGPDRIIRNVYDAAGQVKKIERGVGTSLLQAYATYGYTLNGKQAYVTDASGPNLSVPGAKGNRTTFEYDGFDRLTKQIFPVAELGMDASNPGDFEEYQYDQNDNRSLIHKRDKKYIYYSRDENGRLIAKIEDNRAAYYKYDLSGKLKYAKWSDESSSVYYEYDMSGRPILEKEAAFAGVNLGSVTMYSHYDAAGSRIALYGGLNSTEYVYDAANRLTEVHEYTAPYAKLATFTYDALNRRTSLMRGNGTVVAYGYDGVGRLKTLSDAKPGAASSGTSQSFLYSPAGQIVDFGQGNPAFTWTGQPTTGKNTAANGLNQDAGIAALNGGGYDANGNLIRDGVRTLGYDAENRLVSVSGASNLTITYDPIGRISTVGGLFFFHDGEQLRGEYMSSLNRPIREYVHGVGTDEPLAVYDFFGALTWLHQDRQSSVIATSDLAGTYTPYTYGPYGEPQTWAGSRFRYTGQIALPEAQLYHYKARVYDPMMGRFLQTDPSGYSDGLNWYAYTGNDPVNGTDPTGEAVRFSQNGNQIRLVFYMRYTGAGATPSVIRKFNGGIERAWTGRFGRYNVVATAMSAPAKTPSSQINTIRVPSSDGRSFVDFQGANSGKWYSQVPAWVAGHEAGHLAGLPDRYTDAEGPNPGWEKDIMGAWGEDASIKDIREIISRNSGQNGTPKQGNEPSSQTPPPPPPSHTCLRPPEQGGCS